jgi:hypothetical protein
LVLTEESGSSRELGRIRCHFFWINDEAQADLFEMTQTTTLLAPVRSFNTNDIYARLTLDQGVAIKSF